MLPFPKILNTFKPEYPVYDELAIYFQNGIDNGTLKLITDPNIILSSLPVNQNYVYQMTYPPIGSMAGSSFGSYVTVGSHVHRVCQHLFPSKEVYELNCYMKFSVLLTIGSIGQSSSTFPSINRNGYISTAASGFQTSRVFAFFGFYDSDLNKKRMIYPNPGQPLTYQDWNV